MQSKGWIWQVCLLLTSAFVFLTCLSSAATFGQAKTTPQEQAAPDAGEDEQDDGDAADEPAEEGQKSPDDTPKPEDSSDKDDENENDGDTPDEEESATTASEDLSEAFLLKIGARTTSDLDKIVKLCESALEKGLDENETEQANFLASESLLRFAEGMAKRTFATPQDRRWQIYRAQALPRLRKAVKMNGSNVAAFILLAKFEAMDPRAKADALKNIEKAIELSVDDRTQLSDALVIRAKLKTDKEAVLADLNQAIKHNADNLQAHELRAWTLLADSKADEAIEDIEYWFKAQPKNFAARVIVAERLRAAGDQFDAQMQEKVIGFLDEATEINPESGVPDSIKAQIFLQQEEIEKAIEAATKSIDVDNRLPVAYRIRAAALAEQGDLDAALEDADRLMKLDLMSGYQLRSQLFIQMSEYSKAIDDLQAMLAANPSNEPLKLQLAILHNADLRPEESIKIYSSLLRDSLVPGEGDQPDAVRRVMMAKRADLLNKRGDARLSTGEHDKALRDYDESLSLIDQLLAIYPESEKEKPPRASGLLNNFAWLLATSPDDDLRDGKRAIELATEAAEITEFQQAHILSTVAAGYAEAGDFKSAIEWIEKGLKINKAKGEKDGASEEAIKRQEKSLNAELKSYQEEKPWREQMDPEEERAKAQAEQKEKSDRADEETDSDKEDDSASEEQVPEDEAKDSDDEKKESADMKTKDKQKEATDEQESDSENDE